MLYLVGGVNIQSEKSLDEVAAIVSERLLGGVPFAGNDEGFYDEVPAVYASRQVLGLTVILQGVGGSEGYFLELYPENFPSSDEQGEAVTTTDITEYLLFLLSGVDGLTPSQP